MIVVCPCIECKHNDNNQCKADKIVMSNHRVSTVWEGRQNYWKCKMYELSELAKQLDLWCRDIIDGVVE